MPHSYPSESTTTGAFTKTKKPRTKNRFHPYPLAQTIPEDAIPQLLPLPMESIPLDMATFISAPRKSGKSVWIKDFLCQRRKDYDKVVVFTHTKVNGWYGEFVPDKWVLDGYHPDILWTLLEYQHTEKDLYQKKLKEGKKAKPRRMLILLDDVIGEKIHDDPALQRVFSEGRHTFLSIIISVQYVNAIGPLMRTNADAVILFDTESRPVLRMIWEYFMSKTFPDYQEGVSVMNKAFGPPGHFGSFCCVKDQGRWGFYQYVANLKTPRFSLCQRHAKQDPTKMPQSDGYIMSFMRRFWKDISKRFAISII